MNNGIAFQCNFEATTEKISKIYLPFYYHSFPTFFFPISTDCSSFIYTYDFIYFHEMKNFLSIFISRRTERIFRKGMLGDILKIMIYSEELDVKFDLEKTHT